MRSIASIIRSPKTLLALLLGLSALLGLALAPLGYADGAVHLYYFYDPHCSVCEAVHREVLEPLKAAYGERLVVEERNINEGDNFELMLDLEAKFQVVSSSIPEVFIGQEALVGDGQIRARLEELIVFYLGRGGVALPEVGAVVPTYTAITPPCECGDTPTPRPTATPDTGECSECEAVHAAAVAAQLTVSAGKTLTAQPTLPPGAGQPLIHMAYFYQPGCDVCDRAEHDLEYIENKYPQVRVQRFNIKEEMALNQYLCNRARVPADKHLTAPALFVGERYLLGEEIRARAIESLIAPYLSSGAGEPWAGWEAAKETVEQTIVERFRSFGLLTVIGAGLLDGVNPCAFATMIFLISYLSFRKRAGRELLATGAAFALGVFLTYLGVGFGFLKFLASLPFLNIIGKWIYGLTALLCLALAWGSIGDYRKAKEGRLEDMSLKLPEKMRGWTKTLIREGTGARRFVLSSFVLGFGVSLVELACTGQVYLPTIVFVLGIPALRVRASLALLLYNIMFITPLVCVFLVVYYGTTSEQLIAWMNKRSAAVKLGMAVLFIFLAAWMIYSIIAL